MVAIHLPQEEPAGWPLAPHLDPDDVRLAPARPESIRRAGPDRATRYRRRRLAALVLSTLMVAGAAGAVGYIRSLTAPDGGPVPIDAGPARAEAPGPRLATGDTYVVQPGDTYWSIAATVAPGEDPRPVADRLRAASGDDVLQPGDRLVLDAG